MIKNHLKHHGHYHLGLFLILLLGVILAYYSRDDRQLQLIIIIGLSIAYMVFGIIHHYRSHDLSSKIVVEYIAMGSLGIAIAFFVSQGAML